MKIEKELIVKTKNTEWDLGNKILYDLCKNYPNHNKVDEIIAKCLLIGRAYAAALERRPKKGEELNDDFYLDKVGVFLKESKIDDNFTNLKKINLINENNVISILEKHSFLNDLTFQITNGMYKRSFASKYLHFHFPDLFFIYDSRAVKSISKFKIRLSSKTYKEIKNKEVDYDYAIFCLKCIKAKKILENIYEEKISLRHLDNILMEIDKIYSLNLSLKQIRN